MGAFAYIVHRGVDLFLTPFVALPPLIGLALLGVLTGVALLWSVGKCSPQKLVAKSRDRMTSGVYEIRLYLDHPGRVFKAQGRLIAWSFIYMGSMLPALLVATLPLGLLYIHLEARYGLDPLPVNQPALVRFELDKGVDASTLALRPSAGVRQTSPVLALADRAFLRVVPETAAEHTLTFDLAGQTVTKQLNTTGLAAPEKRTGFSAWYQVGNEPPLEATGITGIFIDYPAASKTYARLPYWWLYWLLIATVAAFALKSKFDVAI